MPTDATSVPCDTCRRLFADSGSRDQILLSRSGFEYRRIRIELEDAADRGCPICEALTRRDLRYPWIYPGNYHRELRKLYDRRPALYPPADEELIYRIRANSPGCTRITVGAIRGVDFGNMNVAFLAFTSGENPAAKCVQERPANRDVGSSQSFALARQWMKECTSGHPQCPSGEPLCLPTRVIDVSPPDGSSGLRLHISHGSRANYAALSYCWGGPQPMATTRASLDSHMRGISPSILPKTVQDAVFTTRQLGMRFLWIDSLCIIQDSLSDVEQELSKMRDIYKNAYVTISAASARDCNQGFLDLRPETNFGPEPEIPPFILPFLCPDGTLASITLKLLQSQVKINEPINDRAWTLQESLLSPRILIYSKTQLFWKCKTAFCRDGGHLTWNSYSNMSGISKLRFGDIGKSDAGGQVGPPGSQFRFPVPPHSTLARQEWQEVIQDYSRRQLSVPEDKLPALSAMAAEYQSALQTEYLAGLWRSYLIFDLMWIRPSRQQATRPATFRCPSWSWASLDGQIGFKDMGLREFAPEAEIIRCVTSPTSALVPFGRVNGGELVIQGPLKKVDLVIDTAQNPEIVGDALGDPVTAYFDATIGKLEVYPNPRDGETLSDESEILEEPSSANKLSSLGECRSSPPLGNGVPGWCLTLGLSIEKDESLATNPRIRRAHGLLLTKADSDRFQRVGWFHTPHKVDRADWFISGPRETIVII